MNDLDYIFKIILLGDSAVGKSSSLLQFMDCGFNHEHQSTIGIEYGTGTVTHTDKSTEKKSFSEKGYLKYSDIIPQLGCTEPVRDTKVIKLTCWDSAGQERFRSICRSYYRSIAGVILVFDLTNRKSFQSLEYWLSEFDSVRGRDRITFSDGSVRRYPPMILVGNKKDLADNLDQETEEDNPTQEISDETRSEEPEEISSTASITLDTSDIEISPIASELKSARVTANSPTESQIRTQEAEENWVTEDDNIKEDSDDTKEDFNDIGEEDEEDDSDDSGILYPEDESSISEETETTDEDESSETMNHWDVIYSEDQEELKIEQSTDMDSTEENFDQGQREPDDETDGINPDKNPKCNATEEREDDLLISENGDKEEESDHKCNVSGLREVTLEDALEFKERHNLDAYIETSAKTGENIAEVFRSLAGRIYEHIQERGSGLEGVTDPKLRNNIQWYELERHRPKGYCC